MSHQFQLSSTLYRHRRLDSFFQSVARHHYPKHVISRLRLRLQLAASESRILFWHRYQLWHSGIPNSNNDASSAASVAAQCLATCDKGFLCKNLYTVILMCVSTGCLAYRVLQTRTVNGRADGWILFMKYLYSLNPLLYIASYCELNEHNCRFSYRVFRLKTVTH